MLLDRPSKVSWSYSFQYIRLSVNFNWRLNYRVRSDSEIVYCDSVESTHVMFGKLCSQLVPDETLNEAIVRRLIYAWLFHLKVVNYLTYLNTIYLNFSINLIVYGCDQSWRYRFRLRRKDWKCHCFLEDYLNVLGTYRLVLLTIRKLS